MSDDSPALAEMPPLEDAPQSRDDLELVLSSKIEKMEKEDTPSEEGKRISRAVKKHFKELRGSLDALKTPAEQLAYLEKKYFQQYRVMLRLENETYTATRLLDGVRRERDIYSADLAKSELIKGKLEALCKELKKQNQVVLANSQRIAEEEDTRRQELSEKFQTALKDINEKIEHHGDEREKQFRENEMLREKLTALVEQMDVREKQFENLLKKKDLERQIEEAKAKHQAEVAKQEGAKANAYKTQAEHLARSEVDLKQQLAMYVSKFDEFKGTLSKSNDVFASFKKEMDKMTKRIKELEIDSAKARKRAQRKDLQVQQLQTEKKMQQRDVETMQLQRDKLEKLCRGMQADRANLRDTIKQLNERVGSIEGGENKATLGEQLDADFSSTAEALAQADAEAAARREKMAEIAAAVEQAAKTEEEEEAEEEKRKLKAEKEEAAIAAAVETVE